MQYLALKWIVMFPTDWFDSREYWGRVGVIMILQTEMGPNCKLQIHFRLFHISRVFGVGLLLLLTLKMFSECPLQIPSMNFGTGTNPQKTPLRFYTEPSGCWDGICFGTLSVLCGHLCCVQIWSKKPRNRDLTLMSHWFDSWQHWTQEINTTPNKGSCIQGRGKNRSLYKVQLWHCFTSSLIHLG